MWTGASPSVSLGMQACSCDGAGAKFRVPSDFPGARMRLPPARSLCQPECWWLWLGWPEPCCRPFQNLQTKLCGLPSGAPHRNQKLEARRVHSQNQDLYAITQPMGGRDSSCVSWHIVLVTGSQPDGGVAESLMIWHCFWLCNQDRSRRVSHLGASLPSQNSHPWSWTVPGFHNLWPSPKAPTKALLYMDRCQIVVGRQGGDVLLGHLADVTPWEI